MKKIILTIFLAIAAMSACAANEVKNDTIPVNNSEIVKIVEDESVNSKGNKVTKFYFLYDGELISASRHVVESYNLCKKHEVKCRLAVVANKKTNRKRIILN